MPKPRNVRQTGSSPTTPKTRMLYSVRETRELLGGISHTTFYALVGAGQIQLVKLGRRSFVAAGELQRIAAGGE